MWSSVSRAVRIPSRLDTDIRFITSVLPTSPLTLIRVEGNEDFDSESVIAAETGYRGELATWFSVDVSLYHSWYERLRTLHPLAPVSENGLTIQPLTISSAVSAIHSARNSPNDCSF